MSDYRSSGDRGYAESSSSSYRRAGGYDDYDRSGGGDHDRYDTYSSRREEYEGDGYRSGSGERGSRREGGGDYYRQERSGGGGGGGGGGYDRYDEDRRLDYDRSRYDDRSGERYDRDRDRDRDDSYKRKEVIKETYVDETKGRGGGATIRHEEREMSGYGSGGGGGRVTTTSYVSGGGSSGGYTTSGGGGGGTSSTYRERVVTTTERPIYRPIVTPRSLVIQRSAVAPYTFRTGGGPGARSLSVERAFQYGAGSRGGFTPEAYGAMTHSNVSSMMESREREKRDMQDLNERFASYIEKVRFLEAQNRKLADELEKLRASWGKETSAVKAMYQTELEESKKLLDDSERDKAKLEIRVASLEEQLDETRQREMDAKRDADDWRERAEKQNQQLSDQEAEISMLRRRVNAFETDKDKEKKQIAYLTDALNRARFDLDNETLQHVDAENRRQSLEEELEFLKAIHEQEMRELAALAYRDTTPENREFWKNEMGQALREIQQVYDDKLDNIRSEMEFFYNTKIQEFTTNVQRQAGPGSEVSSRNKEESRKMRTYIAELNEKMGGLDSKNAQLVRELELVRRDRDEREREWERENGDLKVEVAKLRAELEAILKELQNIMNAKMGLELEIEAYRKLLETEETRLLRRGDNYPGYGGGGITGGGGGGSITGGGGSSISGGGSKYDDKKGYDNGRPHRPGDDRGGKGGGSTGGFSSGGGGSGGGGGYGGGGSSGGGGYGGGGGGTFTDGGSKLPPKDVKPPISDIAGRGGGGGGGGGGGKGGVISGGSGGGGGIISGGGGRGETPTIKPSGPPAVTPGKDAGGGGYGGGGGGAGGGRGGASLPDSGGRGAATRGGRGSYTGGRGGSYAGRGGAGGGGGGGGGGVNEQKITPKVDPKAHAAPWRDDEHRHEPQHPPPPTDRTPSRTSFQRSSKGPVSVAECAPDGKFITLENTGQKDEFIGGWMLSRVVDDREKLSTVFPSDIVLRSGEKMRIWARGTKPLNASALDIESGIHNWGVGANAATKLTNMAGEERATHVQKTTY